MEKKVIQIRGKSWVSVKEASMMLGMTPRAVRFLQSKNIIERIELTPRCYVYSKKDILEAKENRPGVGRPKKI